MSFYLVVLVYLKYVYKKERDTFSPVQSKIPYIQYKGEDEKLEYQQNTYVSEDTRQQFSDLPPVNPMVRKTKTITSLQSSPDLFTDQPYNSKFSILDMPTSPSNQLLYSGGETSMLEIPLQMNYPNDDEQLRSQKILVTPYNKIKYGSC